MTVKADLLVLPSVNDIDEIIKGISSNINFTKGSFKKVEFRFKQNEVQLMHDGIDIKDFSSVWLSSYWGARDLAYAIKMYLEHYGTRHTYVEKEASKITDQMEFVLSNMSAPAVFFVDKHDIISYVEKIEEVCGYPLIIKDTKGSRGKYSAYVKNREDLLKKSSKMLKHRKYFFQEFIPNEYDWGILVANGKVVSAEKSFPADGEFRNNACNGAKEVFVEMKDIPKPVQDMAVKASKVLGLSWSRSDIIVDKNTDIPYLLEVNRFPGITSGTSEVIGAQNFLRSHLNIKI
jgi:D-alanine-D-alanine ligase-like ATP-grasp enzyme